MTLICCDRCVSSDHFTAVAHTLHDGVGLIKYLISTFNEYITFKPYYLHCSVDRRVHLIS